MIKEIDPRADRAAHRRRTLGKSLRQTLRNVGDLEGFAIVMWDSRGDCCTNYFTSTGPVSRSMMPGFCKDALNRHVAVEIGKEQ